MARYEIRGAVDCRLREVRRPSQRDERRPAACCYECVPVGEKILAWSGRARKGRVEVVRWFVWEGLWSGRMCSADGLR